VEAVVRGGADISVEAMIHAVELYHKEMGYQLCNGLAINTGWYEAGHQFRGIADNPKAQYDKEKYTLMFGFNQGSLLRRELDNIEVEILGVADTDAAILQVNDVKTGSVNDLLTPSRVLKIAGYKIKIAGDNAANGICFVNQTTLERTRVDESDIVTNNPSEVIVMIPELAAGTYLLEVTTQFSGGGRLLNEPRTAKFNRTLTVQ
jgi:hypothetical protein